MKHKLIKVDDYYIVVSDEKIAKGDFILGIHNHKTGVATKLVAGNLENTIHYGERYFSVESLLRRVVASQNPKHNLPSIIFSDEVAKELGIVDIEKISKEKFHREDVSHAYVTDYQEHGFKRGYKQALSDNQHKKYTKADLRKAYEEGFYQRGTDSPIKDSSLYTQSLNPTQWEVELLMEEYVVGSYGLSDGEPIVDERVKIINNSVTITKIIK